MKKMMFLMVLCLVLALPALAGCGKKEEGPVDHFPKEKPESTLYVRKTELPEDFILGMDVSSVLAEEKSGVKYYDFEGKEQDLFVTLAQNGITHIRVRVWNHPYDAQGNGYGGGNNDIDAAVEIGRRAAAAGQKLIVDFHYSDFWADPAKQMVPLAWKDMKIEEKTQAVYDYTKESLRKLKDAGVPVAMVQTGNETNGAMCGEDTWFNIQYLMAAGSQAVREVYPEALVAVHFANPESGRYADFAKKLDYYELDYDVFATSYYPYWHGTLENLAAVLRDVQQTYGKKVMVMETSYAYTAEDTDFNGNTIGEGSLVTKNYPYTVQGQARSVEDVIRTVADIGGIGVCYWEGAWITVGQNSWEENHEKWEKYGSGWASSYAAAYDPKDAGKYFGGSAVDNQTFFGPDGKPLESLKLFALLKWGNTPDPVPDAVLDTDLTFDVSSKITLPETVSAVMTDGSRKDVPVTWNVTEEEIQKMESAGEAAYTVKGQAGGMEAVCRVNVVLYNYLENYSFETMDLTGWEVADIAGADQLYVEDKQTDSLSGTGHMHFWSAEQGTVEFKLEQKKTDLPAGTYRFRISLMGGDAGDHEVYAYALVDGKEAGRSPMQITGYGNWDTGDVDGIRVEEGQEVVVGIYVKCRGEGSGAWGKIDDALLNSSK